MGIMKLSKSIASLSTGLVTSYALYILIGLILFISMIGLAPTNLN
jgi:NADH-ubiquinone oxidoreductase chain 5